MAIMIFASRSVAGRRLADHLVERGVEADCVLGLPRGGLIVAHEVAARLGRPLDALVVRKIGHPRHREFAVGSLAEPDIVLLDEVNVPVDPDELAEVIEEEKERLREYRARFHRHGPPDLKHQAVLLVDDGLATGATMAASVKAARQLGARRVVAAAPVASDHAVHRLRAVADAVEAVLIDPDFVAVGQYYESFPQTTDEEVRRLLGLRASAAGGDPESL